MRNRASQSNLPFVAPTDEITYLEFSSRETPDNIASDDPPKTQHHYALHPDPDEELSDEVFFNDDSTSITRQLLFSSLHLLTKPSSSRKMYDFGLSSSSSEPVDEEIKIDDQAHKHIRDESESTPPNEDNTANATQAGPSEPPINQEEDKAKSRTSPSDIGSSTSNYVDLFALLEL